MKKIDLYDAVYFLRQCKGVLLEGRFVEPILHELEEEDDNEFLTLEWDDIDEEEGKPYFVQVGFKEGGNWTAGLDGSTLILTNDCGEEERLTLLQEWHPLYK